MVSVPSKEVATAIANALLNERLVACTQLSSPIESSYWWNNQIETSSEYLLTCKAAFWDTHETYPSGFKDRVEDTHKIETMIKALHPYQTPEIIWLPISKASSDYQAWLVNECSTLPCQEHVDQG
jgi:periplasmic divalent cation tolerance protein